MLCVFLAWQKLIFVASNFLKNVSLSSAKVHKVYFLVLKKTHSKYGNETFLLRIKAALCSVLFADLSIYLNSPLTHEAIVCTAGGWLQLNGMLDYENHETPLLFQTRINI